MGAIKFLISKEKNIYICSSNPQIYKKKLLTELFKEQSYQVSIPTHTLFLRIWCLNFQQNQVPFAAVISREMIEIWKAKMKTGTDAKLWQ